ncbi:MAG: phosphatase PAP2 family protein [Actinomycetes bacterium]
MQTPDPASTSDRVLAADPATEPGQRSLPLTFTPWNITRGQWIISAFLVAGIILVFGTYIALNFAPPSWRWPTFWAYDPEGAGHVLRQPYDPTFDPQFGTGPIDTDTTHTFVLRSWLDAKLPFVPLLVLPYGTFMLMSPLMPILNLWVGSFRRFLTVAVALIVSLLICDVGFFFFQTEVLRDKAAQDVVNGGGFIPNLVGWFWGNDAPFNGYPSGHITWTVISICALWRLRRAIPKTAWILMIWISLVIPATVMLRQHYLMDVYAGIFIGFGTYWACMFIIERPRLVPRREAPLLHVPAGPEMAPASDPG